MAEQVLGYVDYQTQDYNNPLKSVTHHQTMSREGPLNFQIKRLMKLRIPDSANMSIKELLKLPLDEYSAIVNAAKELSVEEGKRAAEREEEQKAALEKLKGLKK